MSMDKSFRPYIAELIGTFAVVFLSAGAVCAAYLPYNVPVNETAIALAEGLAVAVALSCTINVSGGYLNPAVTIALWALRRLDNRQAPLLLVAQLLGAALAGACLRVIFHDSVLTAARFGTPHLTEAFGQLTSGTLLTGAGVELVLTFLLTFAIFGSVIDPRTPRLSGIGIGLIVGLMQTAVVLVGFRLTGASVNPARSFGTYIWEMSYRWADIREQIFVYWVGPIAGALLAGLIYTYAILPAAAEKKHAAAHK
jgi:aquaporin TIP